MAGQVGWRGVQEGIALWWRWDGAEGTFGRRATSQRWWTGERREKVVSAEGMAWTVADGDRGGIALRGTIAAED